MSIGNGFSKTFQVQEPSIPESPVLGPQAYLRKNDGRQFIEDQLFDTTLIPFLTTRIVATVKTL